MHPQFDHMLYLFLLDIQIDVTKINIEKVRLITPNASHSIDNNIQPLIIYFQYIDTQKNKRHIWTIAMNFQSEPEQKIRVRAYKWQNIEFVVYTDIKMTMQKYK